MRHQDIALHLREFAVAEDRRRDRVRERNRTAAAVCVGIGVLFGLLWSVGLVLTMHAHGLHLH